MKKVGLITCYMDNFGACLQAYALQTVIEKEGFVCEIIKYTPVRSLIEYNSIFKLLIQIRSYIKGIKNISYRYINYRHSSFVRFRKDYLQFSQQRYIKESELLKNPPIYDIYIVGSDQLWNPNLFDGKVNKAYFLDFVPQGRKKIAYAPSIGVSRVSKKVMSDMARLLETFDFVSVREETGKKIIDQFYKGHCRVVLDPTLLISREEWDSIIGSRLIEGDYLLLYLFSEHKYIQRLVEKAQSSMNMMVVTIPFTNEQYYSKYYKIKKVGPLEFLNLLRHASLVITDSFHATAFSICFNTPFYSALRNNERDNNNMNSRVTDLLNTMNLNNRLIRNTDDLPISVSQTMDFSYSNYVLDRKREEDTALLIRALEI